MTATSIFWHVASPGQPVVSLALPPKLFYVRHGCSQPYPTVDGGFIARAPDRDIRDQEELRMNATMHFEWCNWDWDSCFVSAFGEQDHAERWGRKLSTQLGQPSMVYELDTSQLPPGTLVLNAYLLCTSLAIEHQWNDNKDEYLFYRGIPGSCVGRCWDPWWGYVPQVGVAPSRSRELLSSWADVVAVAEQAQIINKFQWAVYCRALEAHQEYPVPLPVPCQTSILTSVVQAIPRGMEAQQEHHTPLPVPNQPSMSITTLVVQAIQERRGQLDEWLPVQRRNAAEQITNTVYYPSLDDIVAQMKQLELETDVNTQTTHAGPSAVSNTTPHSVPNSALTIAPNITTTDVGTPDPGADADTLDPKLPVLSAEPSREGQKKKTKKEKRLAKKERKARNAICWTKGKMLLS